MKEVRRRICQNWIWIELRNLLKILDTYPPTQDDMTPILPISKLTVPICIIRHSSYWLLIVAKYIHLIILCLGTGDGQGNDSSGPTNNKKASCGTALEASRVGTFETSEVFFIKNVLGMSTYKIPSTIKPLSYTNFFSWQSFRVKFIAPISVSGSPILMRLLHIAILSKF